MQLPHAFCSFRGSSVARMFKSPPPLAPRAARSQHGSGLIGLGLRGSGLPGAGAFSTSGRSDEHGASHFLGLLLILTSVYSTYLLIKQEVEAGELAQHVVAQQKKIDLLELKLQVLSLHGHGQ